MFILTISMDFSKRGVIQLFDLIHINGSRDSRIPICQFVRPARPGLDEINETPVVLG